MIRVFLSGDCDQAAWREGVNRGSVAVVLMTKCRAVWEICVSGGRVRQGAISGQCGYFSSTGLVRREARRHICVVLFEYAPCYQAPHALADLTP